MPDPTLLGLVVGELSGHPPAAAGADQLVLAAFEGVASLQATLDGSRESPLAAPPAAPPSPPGVFLRSVEVEGFRGIGPPVTLSLLPGPGLTLVVGRNGSGKSSLAEALEMLLTGSNQRWAARPKVWGDGWRNLHHGPPRISASFAVDGRSTPMTVTRSWADGADVEASTFTIDGKRRLPAESGWDHALRNFPPLLSHNQLGRILEGKPTELYDALALVLGLAEIAAAEAVLRNARIGAERMIKDQQRDAATICAQLSDHDDERAAAVIRAISGRNWDLEAVQRVVAGGLAAVQQRTSLQTLRELSTLTVLDRERLRELAAQLREMDDELGRLSGGDAAAARETALLLEHALTVHAPHQSLACPVCGSPEVLTYEWRLRTASRIAELRAEAAVVERAHSRAASLRAQARRLVTAMPGALAEAAAVGVDGAAAVDQWQRWSSMPEGGDLLALSTHLETVGPELIAAVADVRASAGGELERREDRWRPIAQRLVAWLPGAEGAEAHRGDLPRLKAAEAWLRDAHEALRRQRFRPIAAAVEENWQELRQSSSVQLGELRLDGTGSSSLRRLTLDVSIDGEHGSALGVMSQGELNCLALSLFLPRASMPESPFRFLVIDDPVQAMDPVKVEGLAMVLRRVAQRRQVVVLTHDDRLADAVRRLDVEASIIEVSRRENSVVELRTDLDPVQRHINDALAVAMSRDLPPEAKRVVPGFCRYALEAACVEAVTRRFLREGRTRAEMERELQVPTTLVTWLALALLNDATRSGEVMGVLNRSYPWAADVVRLANRGSHTGIPADLLSLVRAAERLSGQIRAAAASSDTH